MVWTVRQGCVQPVTLWGAMVIDARFRCVIVLASPDGQSWSAEGECAGRIIDTARGRGGFGYDPIFFIPSLGQTMAELSPDEKNIISHRARATQAIRPVLAKLTAGSSV
jgi:XTP/dITP diphosphohydrolase